MVNMFFERMKIDIILAWLEPSNVWHVITAWCFLSLFVLIEMTLPTILGQIIDQNNIIFESNFWMGVSAMSLNLTDKVGTLLFLYCLIATIVDVIYPNRMWLLNVWNRYST